jgi:hypothetical protein
MPKDFDDKIRAFHKFVIRLRKNNTCLLSQIGNMDQTSLCSDMLTSTTIQGKGEKSVIICSTGSKKQHHTVRLAMTAGGRKCD